MGCGSPSSWYGGLITKRLPPSLTLFASESAARRPRRQPLNVIGHRREQRWKEEPDKLTGFSMLREARCTFSVGSQTRLDI